MTSQDMQSGIDLRQASPTRTGSTARPTAHSRGSMGWPILAVTGFIGFAILTGLIASGTVIPFDQPLLTAAGTLGAYLPEWNGLSDAANYPMIVVGVALVGWLLLRRHWAEAVLVVVVLALATGGSELVKQAVARPRPPGFDSSLIGVVYSYPSGHVLEAITIFGMIAIFLWRSHAPRVLKYLIPILFIVDIVLLAIARVAVNAHYPSDVLGGILAGIACLATFAWAVDRLERRREHAAQMKADPHGA